MTGTATRPATTEGSAPSMPAATTMRADAGGAHLLERPGEPVQAGDAHVEGGHGVDPHGADHRDGLAGDGHVAGAGREDADRAAHLRRRRVRAAHDHDAAARVVLHGGAVDAAGQRRRLLVRDAAAQHDGVVVEEARG